MPSKDNFFSKLNIYIISYNRSELLDKTLKQLAESPFSKCKIIVLDNCSTDNTSEICKSHTENFENFETIRHKKNIGGGSNYLRAVELADNVYTWIICDDDLYDFSHCDDVIDIINNESYDLISMGEGNYDFTKRGYGTTIGELLKNGEKFYTIHAFIPTLLFKTSLFDSDSIIHGYLSQNDMFPQFYFLNKCTEKNNDIYISNKCILLKAPDNSTVNLNPLFQFASWVNNCCIIKDKYLRRKIIYEGFYDKKSLFIMKLGYYIYFEKVLAKQGRFTVGKEGMLRKIVILLIGFTREQFLILLLLLPLLIIPSFVYKILGKLVFYIYYKGNIPDDKNPNAKIDARL